MRTEPIVRVTNVEKTYQQGLVAVEALKGVDLAVAQGEFLSLVGPSGSGKSTLLHIIGALDVTTSGEVEIQDVALSSLSAKQRTDLRLNSIGFVFQAYNLIPVLSAVENVEFILHLQGVGKSERRSRALGTLGALGLEEVADRRPGEMSGGQQQRVAIARAIVSNPIILLADEPSANLDSQTTIELCETLQAINQEHDVTIITATHDPLVMSHTQRRVDLRDGIIVDDVVIGKDA